MSRPALAPDRRPSLLRRPWLLLLTALLAASPAQALPDASVCRAAMAAVGRQQTELQAQAPRLQVLLLGEIHTSAADHRWQLQTLESLQGQRPLSLALEMVPARRQAALDRYGAGQLREQAFLEQVGWAEVWGHDPDLYWPLLRWAQRERVPLLALNAEPALVRRVRREGLAAIPSSEREGIGTPIQAAAVDRQQLELAWRGHRLLGNPGTPAVEGSGGRAAPNSLTPAEAEDLERFIAGQMLRDRAMAERISAALRREPQRLVVVLVGQGHLNSGGGIPRQLKDLGVRQVLALQRPDLPAGCEPAPAGARLGVYLESVDGAIWVRRVAPGSAAAAAGIRAGDRIVELNGAPVERAGQVIRRVRLQPDGEPLRLTIERAGRRLQLELKLPASTERRQALAAPIPGPNAANRPG